MQAILLVVLVGAGSQVLPVPTGAELVKAEQTVRDVFADQLKAARTPEEKSQLAQKMLETAAGSAPAGTYVLLQHARQLAIAAGDAALGMRAVEETVDDFAPEKQQEVKQWASQGNRLWNEADSRRMPEKLKARLAAAECYLRAVDGLEGIQQAVAQDRLKELGWKPYPIEFTFDKSTEGWTADNDIRDMTVQDGCLHGHITAGDPYLVQRGLHLDASRCKWLEIRMSNTAGKFAQIYWATRKSPKMADDKQLNFPIVADGQFHTYRIDLTKHKPWSGEIIALRIDPGEWDHQKLMSEDFSIDFIRGHSH